MTKLLSLFFIKKYFRFKIILIFFFGLVSCNNHLIEAKEISPISVECKISKNFNYSFNKNKQVITSDNKDFNQKLIELGIDNTLFEYNVLVYNGTKPTAGFSLEYLKSIQNNKILSMHFLQITPEKNSKNLAIITLPFCLLKFDNLNQLKKIEVLIKNK